MDLQKDLLALLHTFNNDTWRSSRLSCFRWILTYFRLRLNLPFLNWLTLRFSDKGMSFRFSDCEISPVYEEFCAIMDYHPSGEEFLALPPDPSTTYDVLLWVNPKQNIVSSRWIWGQGKEFYHPSGEEFLALPPDPSTTYDVLLRIHPFRSFRIAQCLIRITYH